MESLLPLCSSQNCTSVVHTVPHRRVSRAAQGETVPYVICVEVAEDGTRADGGGSKGLAERAYHVDEVRGNARLAIDTEYYLAHQVPALLSFN